MALRRAIAKKPHLLNKYQGIYESYRKLNSAATIRDEHTPQQLSQLKPAPHPTVDSRTSWKQAVKPKGPIGLLLQSIHYMGVALTSNLEIVQYNEVPIHLIQTPYQYLADMVSQAAMRSRTAEANGTKSINQELREIDLKATVADPAKFEERDLGFLLTVQTGGGWS